MQGFELVFKPAVRMARVVAGSIQRVCIYKGMECGIGGIVGEKAAAVGAQQIVGPAELREGEQKIIRMPGMENGAYAGRIGGAGRRSEGEKKGIGPFAACKQRTAQGGFLKEGECVSRICGDALMNI